MLAFDEASHTYTWDGMPVPNVTSIIKGLTDYSHIPEAVLKHAQEEGKAVHKMVELDCLGQLTDLPSWMYGHFDAWTKFKAETGFECFASERRIYHRKLKYAGTLDLAGRLKRLRYSKKAAVIDVKRSLYAGPVIGLQTIAYADGAEFEDDIPESLEERYALQLKADGTYRLQPYTDREDRGAFLACLQQTNWRKKHGINGNATRT